MKISYLILCGIMALSPALSFSNDWVNPHVLSQEEKAPVALLPFPVKVEWTGGFCPISTKVEQSIDEKLESRLGKEGYLLQISPKSIKVKATTSAGLFYAKQTLAQLKTKDGYPCCEIEDYPAFAIRGMMHDTGRNFQTIESLKKQLDVMAALKLNVFHWHLTDHPAWRIESKKYPLLNDPAKRRNDRDEKDTYSMAQIKDLFNYAKQRHIQIIPEIDMPGHSEYFEKCFGVKMNSPKGMDILEELLDEFFTYVTPEMAPYFHFGADEVRIPNAKEFVERFSNKLKANGRIPMQWAGPHDLPVHPENVGQLWNDENSSGLPNPDKQPGAYVDSSMGYMNAFEPGILVRRVFFRQPCGVSKGNEKALGPIICLWPDVRVDDKSKIARQSAQWPVMFAMAERSWKGMQNDASEYAGKMAPKGTDARRSFELFEKRMEKLSGSLPFPYWRDTFVSWQVFGPVKNQDQSMVRTALLENKTPQGVQETQADGGNLIFRSRAAHLGMFSQAKPGNTIWAKTNLVAKKDREIYAMIGFDSPARSTRRCSGIPKQGEWSQCGTQIWLNGDKLTNTQQFKFPGQRRFETHTWFQPANEMPFEDEEFWWLREPVKIKLKKGDNTLLIEQPYTGDYQNWGISFIPVKKENGRWVADDSVTTK